MDTAAAASTTAGIITAIATAIIATGGLVGALTLFIPVLRNSKKTLAQTKETAARVEQVHTIVNQQHTDAERFIIALQEALKAAGVDIPIDQSKPVTGYPDAQPGQPR